MSKTARAVIHEFKSQKRTYRESAMSKDNDALAIPLRKHRGMEEVMVTPEIAAHWLTFNISNRSVTNARVERFKEDMERDQWRMNGETIRFAYGKLLDGQHRLQALTLSGKTLPFMVAFGLDPETQVTMDTGRSRTPRDVSSIEGLPTWQAGVFGSAVHGIMAVKRGGLPSSATKFTNQDIRNFLIANRIAIDSGIRVMHDLPRKPTLLPFARAFQLHYLFAEKDREKADWFFQRLYLGDNLGKTSPIFHLRNRLMNDLVNKTRRSAFLECSFIIRAWNAVRAGGLWRSASSLYPKDGESPEIQ